MERRMRGVNFGGWFSQIDAIQSNNPGRFAGEREHLETFLSSADFERVKTWGFDHVRLPVDYFNVFRGEGLARDEPTFALLDRAIIGLTPAGLDVMLDLHNVPGHDLHDCGDGPQRFFVDPHPRDQVNRVGAVLLERYGLIPRLLLEILNELVAED